MAKSAGAKAAKSESVFDVEKVRELVDLMEERGLAEVELKQGDQEVRLLRAGMSVPMAAAPAMAAPAPAPASEAAAPAAPAADGPHIKVITSPIVGTFYSRPKPESADFVSTGSKVKPDTVVCIVEAMKVFNDIPAEVSGSIVEVLVDNEEAVDVGRPLFKVDTRG